MLPSATKEAYGAPIAALTCPMFPFHEGLAPLNVQLFSEIAQGATGASGGGIQGSKLFANNPLFSVRGIPERNKPNMKRNSINLWSCVFMLFAPLLFFFLSK